jgi:hypothetical protein
MINNNKNNKKCVLTNMSRTQTEIGTRSISIMIVLKYFILKDTCLLLSRFVGY